MSLRCLPLRTEGEGYVVMKARFRRGEGGGGAGGVVLDRPANSESLAPSKCLKRQKAVFQRAWAGGEGKSTAPHYYNYHDSPIGAHAEGAAAALFHAAELCLAHRTLDWGQAPVPPFPPQLLQLLSIHGRLAPRETVVVYSFINAAPNISDPQHL